MFRAAARPLLLVRTNVQVCWWVPGSHSSRATVKKPGPESYRYEVRTGYPVLTSAGRAWPVHVHTAWPPHLCIYTQYTRACMHATHNTCMHAECMHACMQGTHTRARARMHAYRAPGTYVHARAHGTRASSRNKERLQRMVDDFKTSQYYNYYYFRHYYYHHHHYCYQY